MKALSNEYNKFFTFDNIKLELQNIVIILLKNRKIQSVK